MAIGASGPLPSISTRPGSARPGLSTAATAFARSTDSSKLDGKRTVLDRRVVGMADDLDVARLLVERRGDAGRDRLEAVEHGRPCPDSNSDEIADPDDDEARGLIRRHGAGELFRRQRVADALQLGDAIGRRRRRRRRRRRDDAALQFDRIARDAAQAPPRRRLPPGLTSSARSVK